MSRLTPEILGFIDTKITMNIQNITTDLLMLDITLIHHRITHSFLFLIQKHI